MLIQEKIQRRQITNMRNESGITTTDCVDIERIIKEYDKQFYAPKFDNKDEMTLFLERQDLSKLTQKE